MPGTGSWGRPQVRSSGLPSGPSDGLERLSATDWTTYGHELAGYMQSLDHAAVARVDALWFGTPYGPDQATCAEIGRLARAAPTGRRTLRGGDRGDPARPRMAGGPEVTAIDAEDGSLRLFDAGSGVPLVKAVAASCSVPGVFPPVEIDGRLYIDGGVRSGSGLDLAAGFRAVVGIAPVREDLHGEDQLVAETAVLTAGGTHVVLIRPSAGPDVVLPTDSLDAGRLPDAVKAGLDAGRAQAAALRAILEP